MNSTSSSLFTKILAAALGFGLMAAVPFLTMQYAARAHAETPAHLTKASHCARSCPPTTADRSPPTGSANAERCCASNVAAKN